MNNITISKDNKITLRSMNLLRRNHKILKILQHPLEHKMDMELSRTIIVCLDKIIIATKKIIKAIITHLSLIIIVEQTIIVDTSNQIIIMAMETITRWPTHHEEAVVT